MRKDKQLCGIKLKEVLKKRRLDQALNTKEFAVLAGVSYSTARAWFRLPGFPAFHGFIFWLDFVQWRTEKITYPASRPLPSNKSDSIGGIPNLPPRAARILAESS